MGKVFQNPDGRVISKLSDEQAQIYDRVDEMRSECIHAAKTVSDGAGFVPVLDEYNYAKMHDLMIKADAYATVLAHIKAIGMED